MNSLLKATIENGAVRSFYYLLKLDRDRVVDYRTDNNMNVLHLLTEKNRSTDMLDLVMKIEPSLINEKDDNGETPLHYYSRHGLTDKVTSALGYEDTDYTITDKDGNTILHHMCSSGELDTIKESIHRIVDIMDVKNMYHETAVLTACKRGYEDIYYVLKGSKADLSIKDSFGNTVYHYICLKGICCSLIIPSVENNYGYTPKDYCRISPMYYNFM
jgi:ankyrin repeat protein